MNEGHKKNSVIFPKIEHLQVLPLRVWSGTTHSPKIQSHSLTTGSSFVSSPGHYFFLVGGILLLCKEYSQHILNPNDNA